MLLLRNDLLAEEDAELHQSLQALTRLIQPSVNLVCLHQQPEGLSLDPEGLAEIDLNSKPTHEQTKELAQRVVSVSHPAVRTYFLHQKEPRGWREHTLLHTHRVAIFTGGECALVGTDYLLRLSQKMGLEIIKVETGMSPSDDEVE